MKNRRIILNTNDAVHFIWLKNILYCKSENSYTTFYLTNHKPIMISKNIKEYENQLTDAHFFRSHQSYLVNLDHITKIDKQNGFNLFLSDESVVPTSTRKRKMLLQILQEN
jgi:two-component system LytT family response regulator